MIQSKLTGFSIEQVINDRAALVEQGDLRHDDFSGLPPVWTDQVEECQYALSRLNSKIQDLDNLHKKNLHRPTLNDSTEDQHQIEVLTRDISQVSSKIGYQIPSCFMAKFCIILQN